MISELESIIKSVFKSLNYSEEYAHISYSKIPELFDYQINSVFYISKTLNLNPEVVGANIVEKLKSIDNYNDIFDKVEFAKPGFINIKVSENLINKYLNNKETVDILNGLTYFIDYGGPNIAKPLHVGHLRPAIIGESLKRILSYAGAKVISDVHLGDYGLQIGQVIYGLKKENIKINDINLNILSRIYPSMSRLCKEDESVLKECQTITKCLQDGNEEYREYWKKICEISLDDIKRLYNYLGVSFDLWNGESNAYEYIPPMLKYLNSKSVIKEDDGAKIIEVKKDTDDKEMPPLILEKSDGAYLYATTDLASIYERILKYNPNYILYVVDERQRLHFEQVFRVCDITSMSDACSLEHNYFGTINGLDGKPLKTRSGDLLKLDELINDTKNIFISKKELNESMSEEDLSRIVNSIIKFADLQNNREKSYIFDINKFSDTTGKTGPYVLYTAIRIRKILLDNNHISSSIISESKNVEERNLKFKLLEKNGVIERACTERMPHYVADYVYELCTCINTFYQTNNIVNEKDEIIKNNWLNLLDISYNILEELLDLLGISIPSKM